MKRSKPIFNSYEALFKQLEITDDCTISYHHHLRNGDLIVNQIMKYLLTNYSNSLNICASAIFDAHDEIVNLMAKGRVNNIYTNYVNGKVATAISNQQLNGNLYLHTHGGRVRAIEAADIVIDIAFIVASSCDKFGNATGLVGKNPFGSIGYAKVDSLHAKKTVIITDTLVDALDDTLIASVDVDYILTVPAIGDPMQIVSGTTKITTDPIGLKIASDCAKILDDLAMIKDGFSMQTGAGGTSLAVASAVKQLMYQQGVTGEFALGGITKYFVDMLNTKQFKYLYDVQCFDLAAVDSLSNNANHYEISASKYANINNLDNLVNQLDFVVLGATEVDLDFNVNVITDSNNQIIGGSGGHSDTAFGADVTIITTPLIKGRLPVVCKRVNTITTPGSSVDIIVTERGIAINPKRQDLITKLANSKLKIMTIEELQQVAYQLTGKPQAIKKSDTVLGYVIYRDGTVIDQIYAKS